MSPHFRDPCLENIRFDSVFGCHLWLGALSADGYGSHRAAWEEYHRIPVPPGVHIDHTCRRRACRNPLHLDAVTPSENNRRRARRNRIPERCPVGHRLIDGENVLRTPELGFVCALCLQS